MCILKWSKIFLMIFSDQQNLSSGPFEDSDVTSSSNALVGERLKNHFDFPKCGTVIGIYTNWWRWICLNRDLQQLVKVLYFATIKCCSAEKQKWQQLLGGIYVRRLEYNTQKGMLVGLRLWHGLLCMCTLYNLSCRSYTFIISKATRKPKLKKKMYSKSKLISQCLPNLS